MTFEFVTRWLPNFRQQLIFIYLQIGSRWMSYPKKLVIFVILVYHNLRFPR